MQWVESGLSKLRARGPLRGEAGWKWLFRSTQRDFSNAGSGQWRSVRLALILSTQIALLIFAYYLSFQLRFDFATPPAYRAAFWRTLPILLAVKLALFYWYGLCRGWWRYVGVGDLVDIFKASAFSAPIVFLCAKLSFGHHVYPRSVLLIDLAMTILTIGGVRFAVRLYSESISRNLGTRNALIVGAGAAGRKLAHELKINSSLDLNPIGFVDDDPSKTNIKLNGIRVLGHSDDIPSIIGQCHVHTVLIAIPSADSATIQRIVDRCKTQRVELKILPPIADRINGNNRIREIRNVRVEDLLGREPVALDLEHISSKFQDKVTVITGAGGSIGSELARQVARFKPRQLILFERSENDLHKISLELSRRFPQLEHVAVVGDILDVALLREVMAEYRPNSIFHAAAYKHVPMMEKNCFQAVRNNVFGTYNVALVAKQYKVEDFVMISSDKAVNPTNVMGVTKRIAELVILALQHQDTRFMAVRFGNVLASNGSVVPLFEEQIARGGPVTVTHAEAKRYFMTIPEAAQLVLQASVMGKGGEIFLLDMGRPVKIVDLARNLIRLSGLEPESDIKIVYTGLRPGEKLFEELRLAGEGIKPTPHRKIRVLDGGSPDFQQILNWLEELSSLVAAKNVHGLVKELKTIVPEYTPSEELAPLCEIDRHDVAMDYQLAHKTLTILARDVA